MDLGPLDTPPRGGSSAARKDLVYKSDASTAQHTSWPRLKLKKKNKRKVQNYISL